MVFKLQVIVSSDATCVQLRHVFGSLLTACTPTDDEANTPEVKPQQAPLLPQSPTPSTAAGGYGGGGCLAGKRRRQNANSAGGGSALSIPSGAREVSVRPASALTSNHATTAAATGTNSSIANT